MPIRPLDSMTVKKAAFIGLVKINEIDGAKGHYSIIGTIIHSFKISKMLEDKVVIMVEADQLFLNVEGVYLFYAQNSTGPTYLINKHSRILSEEESEKDVAYLLSTLPCVDPKLKELHQGCVYQDGFRSGSICGCDSKTYSKPCEALRNGIVIFTKGACK